MLEPRLVFTELSYLHKGKRFDISTKFANCIKACEVESQKVVIIGDASGQDSE
jgi:hypothetical protein